MVRSGAAVGVAVEAELRVFPDKPPYEVILDEAESWPADMIILGRGRRHGIGRALLGNQTDHVLEFPTMPVTVVPGPPR